MKGIVKLYGLWSDGPLQTAHYTCAESRKRIIMRWERKYPLSFKDCYIHVVPNANEKLVTYDGLNCISSIKLPLYKKPQNETDD